MFGSLLSVLSSFAIILTRKGELVALFQLSSRCLVTVDVVWIFLMVPWVGLKYIIVVFPDQTHVNKLSAKENQWAKRNNC